MSIVKTSYAIEGHNEHSYTHPSSEYMVPLTLLPLPPLPCQIRSNSNSSASQSQSPAILAFGGCDGKIYLLPPSQHDANNKPIAIQEYDEEVRSVAVSPDGLRLAVGFEDGSCKIYGFDAFASACNKHEKENENEKTNDSPFGRVHHPFIPTAALKNAAKRSHRHHSKTDHDDNSDDDGYEATGFLSQISDAPEDEDEDEDERDELLVTFDGPRFPAPIRQMAFDPRSKRGCYHLAIVSESGNPPLKVVNVDSEDACHGEVYLSDEAEEEHMGGGLRSCAYCQVSGSDNDADEKKMLLATLGMDGRLVTWNVSNSLNDPSLEWEACHRDSFSCVPKRDAGEGLADAADRACRVQWGRVSSEKGEGRVECLLLPGKMEVQFRMCPWNGKESEGLKTLECREWLRKQQFVVAEETDGGGHRDTIVSMAFRPGYGGGTRRFVTGGRDGRVLLWEVTLENGAEGPEMSGNLLGEITMDRDSSVSGIPPITSIAWIMDGEEDVIFAAGADGRVSVARVKAGQFVDVPSKRIAGSDDLAESNHEIENDEDDVTFDPHMHVVEKSFDETTPSKTPNRRRLAKSSSSHGKSDEDDDDDDDDQLFDEDAASLSPAKASQEKSGAQTSTKSPAKEKADASKFIDDQAEDDDIEYDDADIDIPAARRDTHSENSSNKPNGEDDSPAAEENNDVPEEDYFDNHDDHLDMDDRHHNNVSNFSLPPLQPAFAPSSTPIGEPRRILCWNHIGVVTLREDPDTGNNLVDIAFLEAAGLTSGKRPISFTDNIGFIVGALGEQGGMFASDLMEDDDDDEDFDEEFDGLGIMSDMTRSAVKKAKRKKRGDADSAKGSTVYFYRFETFGKVADKDWVVALPDGERVLGCATGREWGAVITSRRLLRLFTTAGIQGPVIWIPGEPVTVVGRGRFVAVVYHRSLSPMQDGTQLLGYSLIDGINGNTIAAGELSSISPGASLTWAGFTDVCALSVMDSDGMLSMLARSPSSDNCSSDTMGHWIPMLDTVGLKKSTSDSFWPVEVYGGKLVCVPLRGGKEYPDPVRRPVTTTLPLRIPMAKGLTVKSGPLDEVSVRGNIALNQQKVLNDYLCNLGEADADALEEEYVQMSAQVDKITLKLFMQIVRTGKVERALDLIQRLHLEQSYDIAIQAADRVGHRKLSDRIEEAKLQKFQPLDEDMFFDDNASAESFPRGRSESFDGNSESMMSQRELKTSQSISPEDPRTPPRGFRVMERMDGEQSTDEETPPRPSNKRKAEDVAPIKSKKRINPFAKKRLESPAKGITKTVASPTKLSLSRQSTFSTKSRQKLRDGKQIV